MFLQDAVNIIVTSNHLHILTSCFTSPTLAIAVFCDFVSALFIKIKISKGKYGTNPLIGIYFFHQILRRVSWRSPSELNKDKESSNMAGSQPQPSMSNKNWVSNQASVLPLIYTYI